MLETIELKISSPRVQLPGLDTAIAQLKEFEIVYNRLAKLPAIAVQGFGQVSTAARQMSDYAKLATDAFDRMGEKDPAARMRAGFRTLSEELEFLNTQAGRIQSVLASAPA